jgi:hypothetical protein
MLLRPQSSARTSNIFNKSELASTFKKPDYFFEHYNPKTYNHQNQ